MAKSTSENLKLTIEDNNEFIGIETTAENFQKVDKAFGEIKNSIAGANKTFIFNLSKSGSTVSASKTFAEIKTEIDEGNEVIALFSETIGEEVENVRLFLAQKGDSAIAFSGFYSGTLYFAQGTTSGWNVVGISPAKSVHSHNQSDINGLSTALSGKAASTHSHSTATANEAGFLSADDKKKLDGITDGGAKVTVDSALSSSSTNPVQNKVVKSALDGKASSSHSHSAATTSSNGFMSSSDKTKLNGIAPNANKTTVDSAVSETSTNPVQTKAMCAWIKTQIANALSVDEGGTAS